MTQLIHAPQHITQDALQQAWQQCQSPCFVYDLAGMAEHLKQLMQQDVVKLWYAVKANPLSHIIRTVAQAGLQFDVASTGELNQVVKQGVNPAHILNTGPAKSLAQIRLFLQQGVNTFVAESMNQLAWLNQAATELSVQPTVLLRVQLSWQQAERNPLGSHKVTPFGLAPAQWQTLCIDDFPQLNICGLHIFQWGNMLELGKLAEIWRSMLTPLKALTQQLNMPFTILDLGGGLGLSYQHDSSFLPWSAVVETLAQIKRDSGVEQLWMELGRYAVGPFGHYLVDVVDAKQNFDRQQLVLSAGVNHLLRPAITDQPFPVSHLTKQHGPSQLFQLHGPLCTAMDDLGAHSLPSDTAVGDVLHFSQVGAYGFTESMPYFLCHPVAAEFCYQHSDYLRGELVCVREAISPEDYLK